MKKHTGSRKRRVRSRAKSSAAAEQAAVIVAQLKSLANPANAAGMARYGIRGQQVLGVNIPVLRRMAKSLRGDHQLARALWISEVHEARLLAGFIDNPERVTEAQMERWVRDFDSWDLCDGVCSNLFDRTPFAYEKAVAWSRREGEYVKRAGFVLMAALAVHDKDAPDALFKRFLKRIEAEAQDERNFVKKAVNWALRGIGKRNLKLHAKALQVALRLERSETSVPRWIGRDAVKELTSEKVKERLRLKA